MESALGARGTALNLAVCFALFLALAVITHGQAEDYYIYQAPYRSTCYLEQGATSR